MTADTALPIAVKLIAGFEGFRSVPYLDRKGGVATVGFGFTYLPGGQRVTLIDNPITEAQGLVWLEALVAVVLEQVRDMTTQTLSDNEAAALTSLAYNIGLAALRKSTLIRLLNNGHYASAIGQFAAWVYDDGVRVPGLVRRRAAEAALFAGDHDADRLMEAELGRIHPTKDA